MSSGAASLFLNHEVLYLQSTVRGTPAPLSAYLIVTAVVYVFVRGITATATLELPEKRRTPKSKDIGPITVRPVRRTVPSPESSPAGRRPSPAADLRAAVASAQLIQSPVKNTLEKTPLPGPAANTETRLRREPWKPPWMDAERPPP